MRWCPWQTTSATLVLKTTLLLPSDPQKSGGKQSSNLWKNQKALTGKGWPCILTILSVLIQLLGAEPILAPFDPCIIVFVLIISSLRACNVMFLGSTYIRNYMVYAYTSRQSTCPVWRLEIRVYRFSRMHRLSLLTCMYVGM